MSKLGISSLFKTILLTAALAVSFTASAFTEGTDYMVLEKPIPNADKTLIKVFSYACPFCYKYDKSGYRSGIGKSERYRCFHAIPSGNKR